MKALLEDLSARARRGQLGDSESRELERLLEASLEARLAHRAGLEFDGEDSVLVGDDALIERINQRLIAPLHQTAHRKRRVVALVVGGICTAMAAAAGPALVAEWRPAWPIFAGSNQPEGALEQPAVHPAQTRSNRARTPSGGISHGEQRSIVDEQRLAETDPGDQKLAVQAPLSSAGRTQSEARAHENHARSDDAGPSSKSSRALFTEASLMRRQGRSGRAIQLYSELLERYPHSAEAGSAQIALGMLHLQSGAAGTALTYFNRYLGEHPAGQLGAEALWGKTRALTALGRDEEARRDLLRLVSRYPRSTYATAARAKLGSTP